MTEKQKLLSQRIQVLNLLEFARCDGDYTGINQCQVSLQQINSRLAVIYAADPGRVIYRKPTPKQRKEV